MATKAWNVALPLIYARDREANVPERTVENVVATEFRWLAVLVSSSPWETNMARGNGK